MEIVRWLVGLADKPRALNVALFCMGILGVVIAYNRGQERISALENRLENIDRLQGIREDSLNRVFQLSLTECRKDNDASRERFVELLNSANSRLQEKLDARDQADQKRLNAAHVNGRIIRKNNEITKQINNVSKSIKAMEN